MSPNFASALSRYLAAGFALAFAVGFSGCAHSYSVKIDALANPNVTPGASYRIVPKDAVKADFEPQFAHAVQLIETALATKGYFPAETIRDAEMVIEVDFGIGSKRKRVTEDVDLFNPSHAASSRSSATPPSPTTSSTLVAGAALPEEPPETRVTVITFYEKFLSLSARETQHATGGRRKPVEVWRITVAVEDANPTVDECLPVLVATATDNLGTSTDARTSIRVSGKRPTAVLAHNDL